MIQPIIMHINYCEQGQTMGEVCRKAVDWGFDGVEFRSRRLSFDQSDEDYVDEIARGVEASGLQHVIFGHPTVNLANSDSAVRSRDIDRACKFYQLASSRFQLTVCNASAGEILDPSRLGPLSTYECHGSFIATEAHWEWMAEGFKVLGGLAQELGFRFAFEVHGGYIHDQPSTTTRLVDLIHHPSVGVNLDFGNVVYLKEHPTLEASIATVGESLYYVHLKNSIGLPNGGRIPTALSDGEINHRDYLRLLKSVRYDGPICIEAPRPGDREWFARQDLAYLKTLIENGMERKKC